MTDLHLETKLSKNLSKLNSGSPVPVAAGRCGPNAPRRKYEILMEHWDDFKENVVDKMDEDTKNKFENEYD